MLGKLKGSFDKGLTAVSVKSESIVETSRTKTAIAAAQKQREELVFALGEAFFAAWKEGTVEPGALQDRCQAIAEQEQLLKSLEERLEQIKREEDQLLGKKPEAVRFCPACGAKQEGDARFCSSCGKSL